MKPKRFWPLAASIAVAFLAAAVSLAENLGDRDTREIANYVLTDAALAKYTQATKNLGARAKKMRRDCGAGDDVKSLDDMVAHFNAVPGAQAAIKSAGLSTREYLVFAMSLFQNGMAAWVLTQPGGKLPPGTSMANVKFYQAHEAAIKKLGEETKSADCDDGESRDDSGN